MKSILIVGAGSYIGVSFENYIKQFGDEYAVDTVDTIGDSWKQKDFSQFDVIFHVAGIAHIKETKENAHLYYEVNRDLAIEVAKKAKSQGVKQFIFLSSMSVYGLEEGVITKNTLPVPKSNYGISKLNAEDGIRKLENEFFKVCVLRPPMVYGEGCKGNYQVLVKLARKLPVFPDYKNRRSMISVENLSKAVKSCIENESHGIFCPQDPEYVCTSQMVKQISESIGKKMVMTKFLNPAVFILTKITNKGKKAFGNLVYEEFDFLSESE